MLGGKVTIGLLFALLLAIGWGGWNAWAASDARAERDKMAGEVVAAQAAVEEVQRNLTRTTTALENQQRRADANARELSNVQRSYAAQRQGRGCVDSLAVRSFLGSMQPAAQGAGGHPAVPAVRPAALPRGTAGASQPRQ